MEIFKHIDLIMQQVSSPIILELGCNDGYHSKLIYDLLKSKNKDFKMIILEPREDLIKIASSKINDERVKFIQKAIGDVDGTIQFYSSSGIGSEKYTGSSSINKPTDGCMNSWPEMRFKETLVNSISLHTLLTENQLDKIDFIWADIQGAEINMIKGAKEHIKKIKYLYTEYCGGLYENDANLNDILKLLPNFEVVEDYGGDVLLKNKEL